MESLKEPEKPVKEKLEPVGKWPDEESQKAGGLLVHKGVTIPWNHGEEFGDEEFKVTGLRVGGTGVVYFVESAGLDRKRLYAAKTLISFLKPDYLDLSPLLQKKISQTFLEEILPWLEMGQFPHIVSVHLLKDIVHPGFKRTVPFIFSEYIPGGSLKGYLKKKGRLTPQETLILGIQICDGLLHAYRHGLEAHQDIKPENIMVHDDGAYKVTDFGANVIGSPGYMAPEQVAALWRRRGTNIISDPVAVDQRVDQFAVGLVMLESYLGRHPFSICHDALRDREQAKSFLNKGVGKIANEHLNRSFCEILTRVFSYAPDDRYPDLSSFRDELVAVYESDYGVYEAPIVAEVDSAEWWFHRGEAFRALGRSALAKIPFRKALERYDRIPDAKSEQAKCMLRLGMVYRATGRYTEAEHEFKNALGLFHRMSGMVLQQARCKRNLGIVYIDTGRYTEAEKALREALIMYHNLSGTEQDQADTIMSLGNAHLGNGRFQEAENAYNEVLELLHRIPGSEHHQARCFQNLGALYNQTGRPREAETVYQETLKIIQRIPGSEFERAFCLLNLGAVYFEMGRYRDAEESSLESLRFFQIISGTDMDQAKCVENLGTIYRDTGRFGKAKMAYRKALRIYRGFASTEFHQARCTAELARCFWLMENMSHARRLAREALKICEPFPEGSIEKIRLYCREILEEPEEME